MDDDGMGPLSSTDDQPGIGVSTTVGRLFWRAVGRTRTVQVVRERERKRSCLVSNGRAVAGQPGQVPASRSSKCSLGASIATTLSVYRAVGGRAKYIHSW